MHEALCRLSGKTLDSVNAEDGPPITQRTSGLKGFNPSLDQVALMLFPGLTSSTQVANEYDCSSSTPSSSAIAKYSQTSPNPPVYLIVPFSTDYQSSSGVLNTSSNLVMAARAGA